MGTISLYVNVDHVATLRQQRGTRYPDPVVGGDGCASWPAPKASRCTCEKTAGTFRIATCGCSARPSAGVLNLEMAATEEMLRIAREVRPDFCTLVPEKREERTTEGGLTVSAGGQLEKVVRRLPTRASA